MDCLQQSGEQWTELVSLLPGRTVLVALEEDRERAAALAEHLNVELAVGAPEALFSVMDGASVAVADRKSTRLNSSHASKSRMPSSA